MLQLPWDPGMDGRDWLRPGHPQMNSDPQPPIGKLSILSNLSYFPISTMDNLHSSSLDWGRLVPLSLSQWVQVHVRYLSQRSLYERLWNLSRFLHRFLVQPRSPALGSLLLLWHLKLQTQLLLYIHFGLRLLQLTSVCGLPLATTTFINPKICSLDDSRLAGCPQSSSNSHPDSTVAGRARDITTPQVFWELEF